MLPLVRRDMLPDGVPYRDTGCEINPSCLRCPLARCQFDEPESERRKLIIDARDREIAFIRRRHGATIKDLASAYGLTRRTVFRIIAERRASEGSEKRDAGNGTRDKAMSSPSRDQVGLLPPNSSPDPKASRKEHCA